MVAARWKLAEYFSGSHGSSAEAAILPRRRFQFRRSGACWCDIHGSGHATTSDIARGHNSSLLFVV